MTQTPQLSLIISFYNKIDFLLPVIASVKKQGFKNFEVIISDDGSKPEVVDQVKTVLHQSGLNFQYIWHEDNGFRKTTILNKSVVRSRSEYLVFIDADCILHRHFLHEHFCGRKKGVIRAGRRLNLTHKVTGNLSVDTIESRFFDLRILVEQLCDYRNGGSKDIEQGVYLAGTPFRIFLSKKDKGLLGCNFGMYKADLLSLNGFDERFIKPGVGEDTDLECRVRRTAITIQSINKRAIVYHQYHQLLPRESDIYDIMNDNNRNKVTYTPFGIVKTF